MKMAKTKRSQAKLGNSQGTVKDTEVPVKTNKTAKNTTVPTQRETRARPARQPTPSASPDDTPPAASDTIVSPSPPKRPRPKARRPKITEGEVRRPLGKIDANREMTREEMMAENRLLRREPMPLRTILRTDLIGFRNYRGYTSRGA